MTLIDHVIVNPNLFRPEWLFGDNPTPENLLVDIETLKQQIRYFETPIGLHRDRVRELYYSIQELINNYRGRFRYDFNLNRFLDSIDVFILITNKTILDFDMEVTVTYYDVDGFSHTKTI